MPVSQYRFGTALLQSLKDAIANGRHIDVAIDDYLTFENLDENDPGLWSDLHHGCHRLYRLMMTDAGKSVPDAVKLLALLGVLRDLHGESSWEWLGDGEPSRPDVAIRNFLRTLRQSAPEEGVRLWRLYTRPTRLLDQEIYLSVMAAAA